MDNMEEPPGSVPDVEEVTPEVLDNYVVIKVQLSCGGEMVTTRVQSQNQDDSGESTINPCLTCVVTMMSLRMGT